MQRSNSNPLSDLWGWYHWVEKMIEHLDIVPKTITSLTNPKNTRHEGIIE